MSTLQLGRLTLRETMTVSETVRDAGRTLTVHGKEVTPLISRTELLERLEGVLGLRGSLVPAIWEEKSERNGYYTITDASADYTDRFRQSIAWVTWKLTLARHGGDTDVDLESRLSGAVRANDFSLAGERWHAPPVGAYGYYTGSTSPSTMTRATTDGAITVYRALPANTSPRWGCAVEDYLRGRARILSSGFERVGTGSTLATDNWELSNGLVRVRPLTVGGSLEVAAFTGSAWRPKTWWADVGGTQISRWESATVLRNDPEQVIVRLVESRSPVGRAVLDLTLRRGSRFVEGYFQRGDSGTLSVYLATAETMTDSTSYVVRSTDDANGNRAIAGSARNFDPHASGGLTRTAATAMDFFVGVVAGGGSAVSGDQATNLRDQYLAALPETTAAIRR
ncbi:hypothetical protein [Nonomuraea sp. SYSU D8015]|uniref:hypothetical protein n=1 Tax=Nonomuraea sp. SYSU D8015 TaxID=2593644 RepID=UPI0016605D59|nr:hypothetical protein [Nonomuraea sp. SYSU D8015]